MHPWPLPACTPHLSRQLPDVTASPWQQPAVPHPSMRGLSVQEKSGSWQLPRPRDCVCVPELLTTERKKYTWKGKQTAPGMAAPRFHGDAGRGRGPLARLLFLTREGHLLSHEVWGESTRSVWALALLFGVPCPWAVIQQPLELPEGLGRGRRSSCLSLSCVWWQCTPKC